MLALIAAKSQTFDLVWLGLILAIVLFSVATYAVMTNKPWKAWQVPLGLAFFAFATLVEWKW